MERALVLAVCLGAVFGAPNPSQGGDYKDVDFLMPSVQPKHPDTYLCTPMKMTDTAEYIVGFRPHANMAIAHHILLYGCMKPGSKKDVWNCGEMAGGGDQQYEQRGVCDGGQKILYAWAMDAPSLKLPEAVGFKVGADTGINYLVLQVHYKDVTSFLPPLNGIDKSGITMTMTEKPQRRAGVYLLGTGGSIPKHSVTYMETECPYDEDFEIHPFAFRTHGHTLAQVNAGYRIRNGQWTEIGRQSPQKPQMFYNATTPGLVIKKGDTLAARCTMQNDLDHDVKIGSTQNDEMCNFYVMYYTDGGDQIMHNTYCFSAGPPFYYWKGDERMSSVIKNIPDTASLVPGAKKPLKQTLEPALYDEPVYPTADVINDVMDWNMNEDPKTLEEEQYAKLMQYLQERGPREYDEEYPY